MRTLQDVIDAKLAEMRAAATAAAQWRNGQAQREAQAVTALRDYLRLYHDISISDDEALLEAYEGSSTPETQPLRYTTRIIFPGIDGAIAVAMHRDRGGEWHRSDEAFCASILNARARTFTDLTAALMWLTDNGQTALCGAPVLVTLPQPQEA